jgi:hypothetical protein
MLVSPRRIPIGSALLLSLALTLGCGADGTAAAPGDEVVLEPQVDERFTVGRTDGGGWDSFSRVTSVAFDDQSRLYVLDADEHRVTVVAPDGSLLHQFGSRGDGPGQFRMPQALAVLPGGEVAVADRGHRGLLVFGTDGEHRRTVRFPEGVMGGGELLLPHLDDGVVFPSRGIMVTAQGGGISMPTDILVHRMSVADDGEGQVLHRAWRPPQELGGGREVRGPGGGGMRLPGLNIRAFEPQLHLAALPDGRLAVADSSTYRIRILDPDGQVAGVVERPVEPQPVTDRDRDVERERRLQELAEGGGPQIQISMAGPGGTTQNLDQSDLREMLEAQIREMGFWPEIPVIRRLAADHEGRLWVHRSAGPRAPGPIDILTSEGEVIGSIPADGWEIPHAFGPEGLAAWIETDELEIPRVRVARIERLE